MKYINAAEILPHNLLAEIQKYAKGAILYVPEVHMKKCWGEANGSKIYYAKRNKEIKNRYSDGHTIDEISEKYGLAYTTVKKIIYS